MRGSKLMNIRLLCSLTSIDRAERKNGYDAIAIEFVLDLGEILETFSW